jgi:hypothetical protein
LADKATDKREAAAATKAAQRAAEKTTREAVASALAGLLPIAGYYYGLDCFDPLVESI